MPNWPDVSDNGTCDRCGKNVNMDAFPPCPHGICVCDMCDAADVCIDCRRELEQEMYATGIYDPKADPLYDHNAPKPIDRIERDGGYWWNGSWIEVKKDESA